MKFSKILIIFLLIPNLIFAKGYRPFVCNYHVSSVIAGKQCDGTESYWKIYFPTTPYLSKEACSLESEQVFNKNKLFNDLFPEFHPEYGAWWMIGCDENWIN